MRRFRRPGLRGFTLVELMIVVLIITLTSAMAIPSITRKMKENHSKAAVERFAAVYRNARLRAMGRGSAVLVRYDDAGTLEIREAVQGNAASAAGCATLPVSSCLPRAKWANDQTTMRLDLYELTHSGDHNVHVDFVHPTTALDTVATQLDICFTPMGRAYTNMAVANTLNEMVTAPKMTVERTDDVGIDRMALIPPGGAARVVTFVQ